MNIESGERLSFYKLFKEKNYKIEIPIIQRDYAQGRHTNADIRDTFLEALKSYLHEAKPHRDLDFIYGSLLQDENGEANRFVPLDGQQRLTTLFLLHWYLANEEYKTADFKSVFSYKAGENNWKSKFTYETRSSAREFCDALVSAEVDIYNLEPPDKDKGNALSRTIKNQQWYFLSWQNDPTIQGMLVMLDAIQKKFHAINTEEKKSFYGLLTDPINPVITFQFLKLEQFGLTDDLYIKMNARGKPLTSFENFKAKLEQQIKEPGYNKRSYTLKFNGAQKTVKLHEYFSHKIDTDWANLFWAYIREEISTPDNSQNVLPFDDIIMNFFKTFAINQIAGQPNSETSVRDLIKTDSKELTYNQFQKYNCFTTETMPKVIALLDIFQNNDKKAKQFIDGWYYFNENILEKFLKDEYKKGEYKTAAYVERVMFHAYCGYLLRWSDANSLTDYEGLKNWMRVIHNLTENTSPYNDEREFTNSIKSINEIIDNSNKINEFLVNGNTINGFDPAQVREEKLKAVLIEKSDDWKELIYKAEQHDYFKGQIGFLLRLCGAESFYNKNSNCNWTSSEDTAFRQSFSLYFEKACKIFVDNGLDIELSRNSNFIWERALLTKGNFLIREGSNQSFLIDHDRDISWKRLLKGDKDNSHHEIIRDIFDAIDLNNLENSLKTIIKNNQINDWRKAFIETPELIDYLGGKRYIRLDSAHGISLFKKERMTSAHAELYSYKFYVKHLKNNPISPFTNTDYYSASGAEENNFPCCFLDRWIGKSYAIEIRFINNEYEIRFFNSGLNGIENNIIQLLTNKGMIENNKYEGTSYLITKPNDTEALGYLNELCNELQQV